MIGAGSVKKLNTKLQELLSVLKLSQLELGKTQKKMIVKKIRT